MRPIEIEVLEKLLINEESVTQPPNRDDISSCQNLTLDMNKDINRDIYRKRSNSEPNPNSFSALQEIKVKSASTLSMMASLYGSSNKSGKKSAINNQVENTSITSVESMATTTASVDSFEIALGIILIFLYFLSLLKSVVRLESKPMFS